MEKKKKEEEMEHIWLTERTYFLFISTVEENAQSISRTSSNLNAALEFDTLVSNPACMYNVSFN